jgi:hypothetical protein
MGHGYYGHDPHDYTVLDSLICAEWSGVNHGYPKGIYFIIVSEGWEGRDIIID